LGSSHIQWNDKNIRRLFVGYHNTHFSGNITQFAVFRYEPTVCAVSALLFRWPSLVGKEMAIPLCPRYNGCEQFPRASCPKTSSPLQPVHCSAARFRNKISPFGLATITASGSPHKIVDSSVGVVWRFRSMRCLCTAIVMAAFMPKVENGFKRNP